MPFTRRHLAFAGAAALGAPSLLRSMPSLANSAEEAAVNKAVEALTQAMLAADRAQLEALTAEQLSYGHSSGKVESKKEFIDVVASKKTVYKKIELTEPSTTVVGNNAIVRHTFSAEYESDGKPGTAKIGVMQVWLKQEGWKLLARQSFRPPTPA